MALPKAGSLRSTSSSLAAVTPMMLERIVTSSEANRPGGRVEMIEADPRQVLRAMRPRMLIQTIM